jgi:hypothetical protein
MAEQPPNTGSPTNPPVEHEHSDVNIRAILWFLAALVIGGIVVHVAMWWMKEALVAREEAAAPPLPALAARERLQLPRDVAKIPTPRLEPDDHRNLAELREYEKRVLGGYGWVDRDARIVRVPIDRAMELVLKEGLPARQAKGAK